MIRTPSRPMYSSEPYEKWALIQLWVVGKNCAIVGGNAITAAAKITGITPAMFTRRGIYVDPPAVCRRPTIRFAYWIGMRRWPSWMYTTAATMPIAMSGEDRHSIVPPLYQAAIPVGAEERIDAKITSEMPLPTPRFVIISPIHISSVQPAVSVTTIKMMRPVFAFRFPARLNRYA